MSVLAGPTGCVERSGEVSLSPFECRDDRHDQIGLERPRAMCVEDAHLDDTAHGDGTWRVLLDGALRRTSRDSGPSLPGTVSAMTRTTASEEFDEAFLDSVRQHLVRLPGPWQRDALCAELPFDEFRQLFFPARGARSTAGRAKAICTTCTVRVECLGQAIALRETLGIRGGMALAERRRLTAALGLPNHSRDDPDFLSAESPESSERS